MCDALRQHETKTPLLLLMHRELNNSGGDESKAISHRMTRRRAMILALKN
jgi:hypothetical protein